MWLILASRLVCTSLPLNFDHVIASANGMLADVMWTEWNMLVWLGLPSCAAITERAPRVGQWSQKNEKLMEQNWTQPWATVKSCWALLNSAELKLGGPQWRADIREKNKYLLLESTDIWIVCYIALWWQEVTDTVINVGHSPFFKLDPLYKCLLQDLDKISNLSDLFQSTWIHLKKVSFF